MESEKYLEGQSMQKPPLFESNGVRNTFIPLKTRSPQVLFSIL
jgi:hypothetical protein